MINEKRLVKIESPKEAGARFLNKQVIIHKTKDKSKLYWYYLYSVFTVMSDMTKENDGEWYYVKAA